MIYNGKIYIELTEIVKKLILDENIKDIYEDKPTLKQTEMICEITNTIIDKCKSYTDCVERLKKSIAGN